MVIFGDDRAVRAMKQLRAVSSRKFAEITIMDGIPIENYVFGYVNSSLRRTTWWRVGFSTSFNSKTSGAVFVINNRFHNYSSKITLIWSFYLVYICFVDCEAIADELNPFTKSHIGSKNSNKPPGSIKIIPTPRSVSITPNIANKLPVTTNGCPMRPKTDRNRGMSLD